MILRDGNLLLMLSLALIFAFSPNAKADPPAGGCAPHQTVNSSLAGACRQNAETLKKKKSEYEELLKKKTAAMQKSASAFGAGDQTTEAAVENAKRMFSTMATEQESLIQEVEKKRKDVSSVQKNYDENLGKMMKQKVSLVNEINQKTQFIANEKKSLQELQMGRDPNAISAINEKQKRIAAAESQLTELNKKRGAFDAAISEDRASQGQAKLLAQKFKVSESELNESATKLRAHHARLSGLSLESASKDIVAENKARDEVAAEKAKLSEMTETEGSKKFDSTGKPLPAEESGSQKGVRAALAEQKKGETPDTADAALVEEGKQMAADGKVGKYFKESPEKATELLQAEQSLGTAKDAVAANEKALADIGGDKGLAERLKKSSAVYSDIEGGVDGMPSSDKEGLQAAKDAWSEQYKQDCQNRAVCNALNSYGIKPELTTGTTCVGSGICGVEKKVWDANSGLNDIPVPTNGEQVVKTEGITTELRVAAKQEDFGAKASSRLQEMNSDTLKSAEEVRRNAEIAVKSQPEINKWSAAIEGNEFCRDNPAAISCQGLYAEKLRYESRKKTAEGETVRWDPLAAGNVAAMASDPKHTAKINENVVSAASLDKADSANSMVLGMAPMAGSLHDVALADTNLAQANAAAVRAGGKSEVVTGNLITAQEELASAKKMAVADAALSLTGVGGLTKGGVKAGVNAGEALTSSAIKNADNVAAPIFKSTDNLAESVARDTKSFPVPKAKDDLISATPTRALVSQADEAASTAKAQAYEDVRLNAMKNQSARSEELRLAESKAAEVKFTTERNSTSEGLRLARQNDLAAKKADELAAANENVRLSAYKNQAQQAADVKATQINGQVEELRLARQVEADQAASARVSAQRSSQVEANALLRQNEIAAKKADELAVANENVHLNAYKSQSDHAAQSKVTQINDKAEELRLTRQVEADQAATAKVNAERASQSEANALLRQKELAAKRADELAAANENVRIKAYADQSKQAAQSRATQINNTAEELRLGRQVEATALRRQQEANVAKFQTQLNDNVPLSYPKAAPEFKSASVSGAKGPKEITIYPDTVPEMLKKEKIAHTAIDDTQAHITPGPGNKISRTAAKVENKYGAQTYVDEAVDELEYGGWANKDELTLSRRAVTDKVEQGPLLSHEVEHVKNTSKLAKRVDEGKSEFDWRNITFGSPAKPTGIKQYDQMAIDEVMAYRRSYNQFRFDGNAARATGSKSLVESTQIGAESAAYQFGEKLHASTAYLRSADQNLAKLNPASLDSQIKSVKTTELPLGAPSRSVPVQEVAVREIKDSSGASMHIVKTTYADKKSFTSMVVSVRGNNGSLVPMTMPVPNRMMDVAKDAALKDAKGYVNQALGKMDDYQILYKQSAKRNADIYADYKKLRPIQEADANPGVIGGDSTPRSPATDRRPSSTRGGQLETLGLERAPDEIRSPAAAFDDSSLIGKQAAAQTEFSPRALQEMADRRVSWVLKEHSEFSAISAADNRKFMDLASRAEKGEAKESFFVTENAVLKRLNDDVVKDKDFVTALDNLHKDVLLREIQKDPVLKDAVVASYNDYKSIGFALKKNDAQVRRLLDEKIAKTNQGFDEFLKKVEVAKGWKEKSIGLASDMRTWHHSGIGKTFQEAGLAARRSRELALDSGEARLVNFADESSHYIAATDRMSARSKELATRFNSHGFLEKTPHGTALSEEAIETIRKAKPLGKSEADMNKAVSAALKKRYGKEVSPEEAALLRSQLKDIDAVNPSLLIEKRVEINMGLHDEGVVSFDFKGQNSRNLYQTQMAILKSQGKDMKARLEAIAEGDRIATAQLDDMKARVEKAVSSLGEKYVGKDVAKVVQKSGDDGIFHPLAQLGPAEKAKLAKALNEQKVGDAVRLTYLPKNYRNSKELIPTLDRNRLVVEAEKIEKDLFTEHLVGELPEDVFKGLQVKVDLNPAKEGKSAVGITFAHAGGKEIPAKAEEIARKVLRDKYDISYVDRANASAVRAPAASASKVSASAYSPLKMSKSIESESVFTTHQQWANRLQKMGVETIPSGMEPALSRAVKQKWYGDIDLKPMAYTDGTSRPFHGEILVVNKLPKAAPKGNGDSLAFTHPEMAAYMKKMRSRGYDLAIDTSHPHLGMGAYFDPENRIISLAPNSNWAVFKHEFQHLEFYESVSNPNILETMREIRFTDKKDLASTMHPAYVKSVGADKIRRIQALLDRGVTTETAINESLSVQEELKALGWRRYIPGGAGNNAYRYMLRHQITDLEALGPNMTAQQQKLVKMNKVKHSLSKNVADNAHYIGGGVAAAGTGAGGMIAILKLLEEEPDQIFYDSEGRVIMLMKDGTLKYR